MKLLLKVGFLCMDISDFTILDVVYSSFWSDLLFFFRSVEKEIRPRFPCPYCYADFKVLTYSFLENSHSSRLPCSIVLKS
ncbi:hypothetical protein Hanom_Chr06g00550011 [Helianthus anomalus]